MFVRCPLVHNYSVITQDNWHRIAHADPTRSIDHKMVDCECLFIQQLHGCTVTFSFLILDYNLFGIKFYLENGKIQISYVDKNSYCILGKIILIKFVRDQVHKYSS